MNEHNLAYRIARRAYRETRNMKLYLQWRAFRWRHPSANTSAPGTITDEESAQLDAKEQHLAALAQNGLSVEDFRYLSNKVGTYSWTLMELVNKGEKFDLVYLDGHHTFYVDLPAAFLAHLLLPGGYLFLDDIEWNLEFLKGNMYRFYGEWALYRNAYDFSEYDEQQQRIDHIRMIAESVMIGQLGYVKDIERSVEGWWVLRKPA